MINYTDKTIFLSCIVVCFVEIAIPNDGYQILTCTQPETASENRINGVALSEKDYANNDWDKHLVILIFMSDVIST